MDSEVVISGWSELQAQLDQLAVNIEEKLLRGALRAGQMMVAADAKSRAPVATPNANNQRLYGAHRGDLRKSIRVSVRASGGQVVAKAVAGNSTAYYAHMVEFGTAAHLIHAKNGGALSFGGKEYLAISHPGAKATPFMRPALDRAANANSAAFVAVGEYLQKRITKELAQLPDQADTK